MGIYINMEMPKSCNACMFDVYGLCLINKNIEGKDELTHSCPLVPVPPHGRLIDADAFSAKIIEIVEQQKYDDSYAKSLSIGEILREVVHELRGEGLQGFENAPTIIPASEEAT